MTNDRITRIDVNAINVDGYTLNFDTDDGPKTWRFNNANETLKALNKFADQFVPIYDHQGRQVNRYYGDRSIGADVPGDAFETE